MPNGNLRNVVIGYWGPKKGSSFTMSNDFGGKKVFGEDVWASKK